MVRLLLARVPAPQPIGPVLLAATEEGVLAALDFGAPEERMLGLLRARFGTGVSLADAEGPGGPAAAVRAYFDGDAAALDRVPADGGGTPFQRVVWAALREIPAGETRSYGQIAARIGPPRRAAGRRHGELAESDQPGRALPPGDRQHGNADGLRRRDRAQAVAAGARACGGGRGHAGSAPPQRTLLV